MQRPSETCVDDCTGARSSRGRHLHEDGEQLGSIELVRVKLSGLASVQQPAQQLGAAHELLAHLLFHLHHVLQRAQGVEHRRCLLGMLLQWPQPTNRRVVEQASERRLERASLRALSTSNFESSPLSLPNHGVACILHCLGESMLFQLKKKR